MKPIPFQEQTEVIAKDQPPYLPFPAYRFPDGRIVACWKLNWEERFRIFFSGLVWQQVLTFHKPLQPQLLTADKPI